jgi:tetratricopeptide (TPR) repeat protein
VIVSGLAFRPTGVRARTVAAPQGPAVADGRRGRLLLTAAALLCSTLMLASCGGPPPLPCRYPGDILYGARPDSLDLDAYEALPLSEQRQRRLASDQWLGRLERTDRTARKLQALRTALGLAPDRPHQWLQLAQLSLTLGDFQSAQQTLREAARTLRYLPVSDQPVLRLEIAVAYAWLHYQLADWSDGLAWAERAAAIAPVDRRVMLMQALLEAGDQQTTAATWLAREIERRDFFHTEWRWVRGMAEYFRDRPKNAVYYLADVRPDRLQRSGFYADLGMVMEHVGDWRRARDAYEHSFQSLPLSGDGCLVYRERRPPGLPPAAEPLPLWLAFDRFLAAGSLLAYTDLAVEMFETASDSARSAFWAEAAIRTATICQRKDHFETQARAWRGRVYAQLGMTDLARADLSRARAGFRRLGRQDAATLFWSGQLMLKNEKYREALPLLRQAVAADSTAARAWAGLGLALIMTGDTSRGADSLDRALQIDPRLAVAWYNRGLMNFHAQRYEEAVRDLQEAAHLAPDSQEIVSLLQRARLLLRRDEASQRPRREP